MNIKNFTYCGFEVTIFKPIVPGYERLLKELLVKIASQYTIRYDQSLELLSALIAHVFKLRVIFNVVIEEYGDSHYLNERWRLGSENTEFDPIIEIRKSTNLEDTPVSVIETKLDKMTIDRSKSNALVSYSNEDTIIDRTQGSFIHIGTSPYFSRKFLSYPASNQRTPKTDTVLEMQCKTHFSKANNIFLINVFPIVLNASFLSKFFLKLVAKKSPMGITVMDVRSRIEYDPVSTDHILLSADN